MTDTEILKWLQRIAEAAKWALEDGEPVYLARLVAEIQDEMQVIDTKDTP